MRIPVFARGANPSVDRPILRKSESYCCLQVAEGRADWLDPDDHAAGMICRELLYFGVPSASRFEDTEPDSDSGLMAELPGLRFVPPQTEKNPQIPAIHVQTLFVAAQSWDWSREFPPAELSA